VDLKPADLAVLAAIARGQVTGQARAWWYTGPRTPEMSSAGIEPETRVTGRMLRLQRAGAVPVVVPPSAGRIVAEPTGHGKRLLAASQPPEVAAAQALRAYAQRWHGTTEPIRQPTDYGTGVEYDEVCVCGCAVDEDRACTERLQLLADADAIEAGCEPVSVGDLPTMEVASA
jgi:hypothetical protein